MYGSIEQFALLPAILLALFATAALLVEAFAPRDRAWLPWIVALGLAFTGTALWRQQQYLEQAGLKELTAFDGTLVIDRFSIFYNALFTAATLLVAMVSRAYWDRRREEHGEYYGLLLLAQCGMFFLAAGTDLITLFLGVELMTVCFAALAGLLKAERRSNEAALKYLLLGAFSSGILAYGFSLLYGLSGATSLREIGIAVAARGAQDPLLFLAIATIAVGLLFKISAAPFHMWAPDAYEGAPPVVTAYLAAASKAAALALLLRILLGPLATARAMWGPLILAAALATLVIGNFAAIAQDNLKRLLAYSSIAHAGYLLLGLVAGNETGVKGIAVYILTYLFMTLGVFFCVAALRRQGVPAEQLSDLAGLMRRSPATAVWMLVFLLSLAGLPPTAGFWGKYYIFLSLVEGGRYGLASAAVLFAAVSAYYYFRVIRYLFLASEDSGVTAVPGWGARVTLAVTGLVTLGIGIFPEPFLRFAEAAAR